nr:beta-galactosidase [Clostridia bacterium]
MNKIDIYPLRDEKTILKNPHKGWYWHFIDCGYSRPRYRDDAELIGDAEAFPGLTQLYLRFDWVDINPKKGVYDFSYLDRIMDEWGEKGY